MVEIRSVNWLMYSWWGGCSELAREKMWSRIHLAPLLQAEEDRDQVRRYWADKEREKVLLGTDIKVYNSDRYVERTHDMDAPAFCPRDWFKKPFDVP